MIKFSSNALDDISETTDRYASLECSLLPNASPEYQEMMRNIMRANKDKPVEEVAEMLMHIDQTTARLTNDYVKIMANKKEK